MTAWATAGAGVAGGGAAGCCAVTQAAAVAFDDVVTGATPERVVVVTAKDPIGRSGATARKKTPQAVRALIDKGGKRIILTRPAVESVLSSARVRCLHSAVPAPASEAPTASASATPTTPATCCPGVVRAGRSACPPAC